MCQSPFSTSATYALSLSVRQMFINKAALTRFVLYRGNGYGHRELLLLLLTGLDGYHRVHFPRIFSTIALYAMAW
jgi:hypothetical protein